MSFQEICSINSDTFIELHDSFDKEDDTFFIGIFEENGNGGIREQSVWLTKAQVEKIHNKLSEVLKK